MGLLKFSVLSSERLSTSESKIRFSLGRFSICSTTFTPLFRSSVSVSFSLLFYSSRPTTIDGRQGGANARAEHPSESSTIHIISKPLASSASDSATSASTDGGERLGPRGALLEQRSDQRPHSRSREAAGRYSPRAGPGDDLREARGHEEEDHLI